MKRMILVAVLAAALAPMAALASTSDQISAGKDCTALRAKMGATAFGQAYASFSACVLRFVALEQNNTTSANSSCQAEQADANFAAAHSGKTFTQFYGTGKSGRNAFGNCVSTKAQASSQAEQRGRLNPAQTCRAQRTSLGTAMFNKTYGKNASDKNAFGKCVSANAKSESSNEVNAATACKAEQSDTNFATNHGGKTFDQFYGSNADLSNSFGECVSAKAQASSSSQSEATVSAAKACAAEQSAGAAAFTAKYGTFGKCV
ncbi:MAG TPA: hypothetical protein VM690_05685, partial [Gaiellaceae bacterium]|nr:hypothetical protein [Gaiellaceae bacterium]